MEAFVRATRRGGVIAILMMSIIAGCGLVSVLFSGDIVARLSTGTLLGVLTILTLPIITIGLLRLDQETARERGSRRGA